MEGVGGPPDWSAEGIVSTYVVGGKTVITRFTVFEDDRVDLTDASFSSSDPGWSANGNQVVFTTHLPGSPDAGMQNIWIMKSNGRRQVPVHLLRA